MNGELGRALGDSAHLRGALRLVWRGARGWLVAWSVLLAAQGLLPLATVLLARSLVDGLALAARSSGEPRAAAPVVASLAGLAAVLALDALLTAATRWVATVQSERIQDHVAGLVHDKSLAVDLAFYESPDFHDRLHRAREESGNRAVALIDGLGTLARSTITLAAMAAVLLRYGPWLAGALVASSLPAVLVVARYTRLEHRRWLARTADERRAGYYDWMLTTGATAPEVRLFDLGGSFRSAYRAVRDQLRRETLRLSARRNAAEAIAAAAGIAIAGAAGLRMITGVMLGSLTLGDLALAYQAFQQGQGLMRSLLGNVGQLYGNVLFLGALFDFLSLPSRVIDPPSPRAAPARLRDGIRFDGVRFGYPGSGRLALVDFDLEIPAGKIAAIVGANGAGKSTLVKLLCRFYDPDAGRISLDGIDLRDLGLGELRRRLSVVFQQPVHYAATMRENIAYGDLAAAPDASRIGAAARAGGADVIAGRLPLGYDTLLGSAFVSGTELSVGEWQRIALARAFVRDAAIVILDEPTSAMDSWSETEWLTRLRSLVAGRTAIIITHRPTTAMGADVIHVMAEGRVVESGSHDELLAGKGRYAASWAARARG